MILVLAAGDTQDGTGLEKFKYPNNDTRKHGFSKLKSWHAKTMARGEKVVVKHLILSVK